jgi:hypothetical protein
MAKNPTTEAKTLMEISLEEVFSGIEVPFFHRTYHGQSERKKVTQKRESEAILIQDMEWIDNALFYFSDNQRLEVQKTGGVEVPSAEPSTKPLIKRTSLLHKGFIVAYMLLPKKNVIPNIKEKQVVALANELISNGRYDSERIYLDYNLSEPDGTLIKRVTAATFILDNKGKIIDHPVSRDRSKRLPKVVREALPPQFESFYAYKPGLMDYEQFRTDLTALLTRPR